MGSANLTERPSFDVRYNRAVKAAQREAANRHPTMWAWKGAGHAAEGSAGLMCHRAPSPLTTATTPAQRNSAQLGHPRPGPRDLPGALTLLGLARGAVPACGSQVCQQGKKLWEEESRWHGIKGDVKETDRIFSAATQRGELEPCHDPLRRGGGVTQICKSPAAWTKVKQLSRSVCKHLLDSHSH